MQNLSDSKIRPDVPSLDAITALVIQRVELVSRKRSESITPATDLHEIGIDSLDVFQLLLDLEDRLEVAIDETVFSHGTTIQAISALVRDQVIANSSF